MDPQRERPKKVNTEHLIADRQEGIGVCGWILVSLSFLMVLITFPISIWACIKVVREYERAVVFRLGRILSKKAKGPGMILVLPCTDIFIKVDLRTVTCKIPPQELLTRDAVTAQVDGVVHYKIHSAVSAVANVTDVHSATLLLAQTTLRNVLGTQSLAQLLAGREEIAHNIQAALSSATEQWGVKVTRVEIKDIRIPMAMQRAMAAEAEAAREIGAKVRPMTASTTSSHFLLIEPQNLLFCFLLIVKLDGQHFHALSISVPLQVVAAEGEMNASKALQQASMVLAESPAGLQLRYLQILTTVAAQNNSTIVFPLPINMFGSLGQKSTGG
ncbi:stomatin-like protein 3 isoform X1 [Corvus moneduloides]|uniref:stomatin-like protein 3 isoform X1 n=1 Tax=Corvus moneduloides TaxID=1196302 RepID=UPI0013624749|nr:stomatin-like protein 3 isoform X1 [Corvus moneduloides]